MKIHVTTNTSLFHEDPDRICEYHYQENQKLRENRTNCGSDHVTFSGLYNPHKHHDCQIRLHSVNISDSGIWTCELVGTTGFQQSVNFKILDMFGSVINGKTVIGMYIDEMFEE